MLPGNGTIVLDMIMNVHVALQSYTLNQNSSSLISATTQVYLSLGKLIKFCDEILLNENNENSVSLCKENVKEIVELVDNALNNLVKIANEKIIEREVTSNSNANNLAKSACNTLQRPSIDVASQRTSLPDIPLTPHERDILEKSSIKIVRASHSTESILRDTSPPPKPPLPNRQSTGADGNFSIPPPLPPKRRSQPNNRNNINSIDSDFVGDGVFLGCGDRASMRSRSPEDNSSLLSASAGSLDSALNHSREEDELRALTMDHSSIDEQILTNDLDKCSTINNNSNNKWNDDIESSGQNTSISTGFSDNIINRHSNESGKSNLKLLFK